MSYPLWRYGRNDIYKEFLLDDIFSAKRLNNGHDKLGSLTVDEVYSYASDIKATVKLYYELQNPVESTFSSDEKIWLERISRHQSESAQIFLLAVYRLKSKVSARIDFLKELDRSLFFSSARRRSFEAPIQKMIVEILLEKSNISGTTEIIKRANDDFFTSTEFHDAIQNLGKSANGYYGWSTMRYFLFEYEQFLFERSKTTRKKLSWEEFSKEDFLTDFKSIEHIYPQKANHPDWKDKFSHFSVKERNILRNSIGNLLPLSQPKNASLGNKSFTDKKGSATLHVGYAYGCYSENEVAQIPDWNAKEILERGIRLLNFMEQRWGISLGDNNAKINILNLDFVLHKNALMNRLKEVNEPRS